MKAQQVRSLLEATSDGLSQEDEWVIDHVLTRRDFGAEDKATYLQRCLEHVINLKPERESEYQPSQQSPTISINESFKSPSLAEIGSQEARDLLAQEAGSPLAGSQLAPPGSAAASASSPAQPAVAERTRAKRGRPAGVKAAAGKAAQEALRKAERERKRRHHDEANVLIDENAGELLTPEYAATQAKALAKQLFATTGGGAAAAQVKGKLMNLPEIRALEFYVAYDPDAGECTHVELPERCLNNLVEFISKRLATNGSRHGEDQNIHNAILTAVVDGKMTEDRLIAAVARLCESL